MDYNFEILICYDFDEDKTLNILKENFKNNPKIRYIKNKSRGFNLALITGIEISDADAINYMADDHNNSKLINRIFEKYNEGYHVSSKQICTKWKYERVPFLKGVLTKLASFIIFNFSTFPIKDATNSFRLFSRELLSQLTLELIKVLH